MQVYQGRDAKISFCVHAQTMHVYEVRPRRRRDLRDDIGGHISGVRPLTKSSLKSLNFLDTHGANYAKTPAPLQQTKANAGVQGGVLYDAGGRREHRPPAHGFDIGHFSMNREVGSHNAVIRVYDEVGWQFCEQVAQRPDFWSRP